MFELPSLSPVRTLRRMGVVAHRGVHTGGGSAVAKLKSYLLALEPDQSRYLVWLQQPLPTPPLSGARDRIRFPFGWSMLVRPFLINRNTG